MKSKTQKRKSKALRIKHLNKKYKNKYFNSTTFHDCIFIHKITSTSVFIQTPDMLSLSMGVKWFMSLVKHKSFYEITKEQFDRFVLDKKMAHYLN
jgi:hypothetical protein